MHFYIYCFLLVFKIIFYFYLLQAISPVLITDYVALLYLVFGRSREHLPAGTSTLSLEILTDLAASVLITCSSDFFSSPFHPIINRLDTTGFSNQLTSYSIYFCFVNYFSQYVHLIFFQYFLFFNASALFVWCICHNRAYCCLV